MSEFSFGVVAQTVTAAFLVAIFRLLYSAVKSFKASQKYTSDKLVEHDWRLELIEVHMDENCGNCQILRRRAFAEGTIPERRHHRAQTGEIPTLRREDDKRPRPRSDEKDR